MLGRSTKILQLTHIIIIIIIIIIHEFHRDASLEQNFRAAELQGHMSSINTEQYSAHTNNENERK